MMPAARSPSSVGSLRATIYDGPISEPYLGRVITYGAGVGPWRRGLFYVLPFAGSQALAVRIAVFSAVPVSSLVDVFSAV